MKWNKKFSSNGTPRVYESKETVITRWPDGKPKRLKGAKLTVKCGDCKEHFRLYKFDRFPDEKIKRDYDLIEFNGVMLKRKELKKILDWAGY